MNEALAATQSGRFLDAAFIAAVEFLLLMLIWGLITGAALLAIRLLPGRRWRHRDPTIRRAALASLTDGAVLRWIARHDADAGVREAAQRVPN